MLSRGVSLPGTRAPLTVWVGESATPSGRPRGSCCPHRVHPSRPSQVEQMPPRGRQLPLTAPPLVAGARFVQSRGLWDGSSLNPWPAALDESQGRRRAGAGRGPGDHGVRWGRGVGAGLPSPLADRQRARSETRAWELDLGFGLWCATLCRVEYMSSNETGHFAALGSTRAQGTEALFNSTLP